MARLQTKSDLLKVASVVATIPAFFLLFSGGFMLVQVSAAYAARDLLLFGLLPVIGGFCWLIFAAWFWSKAVEADSLWDSIGLVALRALGAIAVASVGAVVMKIKGR